MWLPMSSVLWTDIPLWQWKGTLCRLLGIDGVDANAVPLPNVVVDSLKAAGVLGDGALFYVGNAMAVTGKTPMEIEHAI